MNDRYDGSTVDLERELVRVLAERRMSRRSVLEAMAKLGPIAAIAPILAACSSSTASASPSASSAAPSSPASAGPSASPAPTPVPSPETELNVYNWDAYIGEDTVAKF